MSNDDDKALVLRFFECRFHDLETAWTLVAEDARWHMPGDLPMSGTYVGRESIFRDYLEQHATDFKDIRSTINRVIAEDGCVVVEYHAVGTTVRDRRYDTIYYFVVDVRDGLIQNVYQSLDTQYAQRIVYDD